ncbi:sulfotransferase [Stenotrophomonas sp. SY1]|uniref:tetratricopeptide repeat-containing sulfotransferase family protein n=1 Tax=Stenotrophomonas sp. SY1 TaxID=477235 RepID=UPI001E3A78F2|nr:sulfotransferase [Stenotrophomonas sp. SY1]MCD9086557.1 sulfotransferase [Stenotrophomonas sp. SY1]
MNAFLNESRVGTAVPPLPQAIAFGNELLRQGRLGEAVDLGEALAAKYPDQPRAFAFAAEACRVSGKLDAALLWIDKAIAFGGDPQHQIKKAWLLSRLLRRNEIPVLAAEIDAQSPNNGLVQWQLGKLLYHHNLLGEAISHYERALSVGGEDAGWRYDLAIARFYSGDSERAEHDLDKVLEATPQAGSVIYLRSTLRRQSPDRNHVADLEQRLKGEFRSLEEEAGAHYALAKELEDLGDHERSFDALIEGARKKRAAIQYDVSSFVRTLQDVCGSQDAEAMAAPVQSDEGEGAIFIVGMPRSGTTLTERILLQSGKVRDAGELMDFGYHLTGAVQRVQALDPSLSVAQATMKVDFAALGREYMKGARQMAEGSPLFIDKLPANYMYCGLIHKALPRARIIHLVRDPLDSCYAVFKTLFFKAYDFSYDLEELGDYFVAYRQMMRHWHKVVPGGILDVHYEDLVSDTESQARRIYEWCNLEWVAEALAVPSKGAVFATASAAQVREPVHSRSVNSSRRHVEKLGPLIKKLTAAGILQL